MIVKLMEGYILLMSYYPCEIFEYFNVQEMHGLNYKDCKAHVNTDKEAYIAGWCNYVPKDSQDYKHGDSLYVFINLSRCTDDVTTTLTLFHEFMHLSGRLFNDNWFYQEEEMISFAEKETAKVFDIVKKTNNYETD